MEDQHIHELFQAVMYEIRTMKMGDILADPRTKNSERRRANLEKTKLARIQLLKQYVDEDPKFILKVESLGFNVSKIGQPPKEYKPREQRPLENKDQYDENRRACTNKIYHKKKSVNGLV